MKKILAIAAIAGAATLTGCAITPYQGGMIYTQQSAPIQVTDNATACNKRGTSTSANILGLIATGDAGLEAAKRKGGITKVGSVDVNFTQILGIFGTTQTVVCGE